MRKLFVAATAVCCLVPASVQAHNKSSVTERYFAKRCHERNTQGVLACIHRAALHWDQSYSQMKAVAWRESKYNPNICNTQGSGACGLFQFMPGTWASTPYRGYSVFSAKYASLATAWAWSRGWQSHWVTY